MADATTETGRSTGRLGMSAGPVGRPGGRGGQADEAQKHSEGPVARGIEHYTAQAPSDWFLWAAGASLLGSLALCTLGRKHDAILVGQWAAPFLLLGVYNKIVKVAGSDRVHGNA